MRSTPLAMLGPRGPCAWLRAALRCLRQGLSAPLFVADTLASGRSASRQSIDGLRRVEQSAFEEKQNRLFACFQVEVLRKDGFKTCGFGLSNIS
jgi:hypothetical protein